MKIILTDDELADAIAAHYPAPAGYQPIGAIIQRHSPDFCIIELHEVAAPAAEPQRVDDLVERAR